MRVNIKGGTANHSTNLCLSCKYASIREAHDGAVQVQCEQFSGKISPTVRCSVYEHKNNPDMYEMKQIAWVITPGREALGFRPFKTVAKETGENFYD